MIPQTGIFRIYFKVIPRNFMVQYCGGFPLRLLLWSDKLGGSSTLGASTYNYGTVQRISGMRSIYTALSLATCKDKYYSLHLHKNKCYLV